ncbi:MAG: putative colanic acid biosynthesis acetyltransferase [Polaromonas sp.]|nr:putative colanic acid biosynthesis acetyltransferase [Polaromonas sp.]
MTPLDASQSKPLEGGPSFSLRHRLFRAAWNLTWFLLAAWTPAPMHRWRVWLLNLFGAHVNANAHVYGSARIWYPPNLIMATGACMGPSVTCYCMAKISFGRGAIVSQGSHLCAGMHDIEDPSFQLLVKPIGIGDHAWIATEAFIGPGVNVGDHAVIGARAVLFRNADAHGVYVGNPAQPIKKRLLEKN